MLIQTLHATISNKYDVNETNWLDPSLPNDPNRNIPIVRLRASFLNFRSEFSIFPFFFLFQYQIS